MLLLNGDCIEQMQKLKDEGKQIDSVVTDPPYHLTSIVERYGKEGSAPAKDKDGLYQRQARGFMGKEWDGGDIAFRSDTWKHAYDLLKPGGYLLAFSASRNYHRMAVAIEDAGFEIRDQIMWIYGSGFPKSLNIGKAIDKRQGNEREVVGTRVSAFGDADVSETSDGRNLWGKESTKEVELTKGSSEYEGWGTALKPAHEPIVMARKPLEGTNIDNVLKYGTGGINIDGCRVESERYPANVMHDGSDVVRNIFPYTKSGKDKNPTQGEVSGFFGNKMGYYSQDANYGDEGSASRYFYCPKTSKSERNQGLFEFDDKQYSHDGRKKSIENPYQRNKSISKNSHPTVKPVELMKYLCRLVTPKGGTVLDPFMGSGSTGMAAKDEGFDFIGIEKEEEYFEIASARIKVSSPLMEFM